MCLDTVSEKYDNPSTLIVDGWKVFGGSRSSNFNFQNQHLNGSNVVPRDKWLVANETPINDSIGKTYTTGFHVYSEEQNSSGYTYTRVFIRKITFKGTQGGKEVVIAKEMYVPSKPDGWPPTTDEAKRRTESIIDKVKNRVTGGTA